MKTDQTTRDFAWMFAMPAGHRLAECKRGRTDRDGYSHETRWLEEYDASDHLVSRVRTWTRQSLSPPYRKQTGWERFSPAGDLMDREVRYSRRPTEDYLH